MFIFSWQITLCLVGVNIVIVLMNGIFVDPIRSITRKISKTNAKMTEKLSNLLNGIEQARMYSAGYKTLQEFVLQSEKTSVEQMKKNLYLSILESLNGGFDILCSLVFLFAGVYFVQKGITTLGALTAIYSLYGVFSVQFLQLGKYFPELMGCLVNAQNIFEFMDEELEPLSWYYSSDDCDLNKKRNNFIPIETIVMENVEFSYSIKTKLLQNISMIIKHGECVTLTGESGCGKTTISKILIGLYPMVSGNVSVMGYSYKKLTNSEIRQMISYVPQEPYLFNMTVRENILIGKNDATNEEIVWAAKKAYAHEFILELENGYETVVGERGNNLSVGQRQRIAIARAIIKDAPIIILDEATSALDGESEEFVNESLKAMKGEKTIIVIAHRPSSIMLGDKVIKL